MYKWSEFTELRFCFIYFYVNCISRTVLYMCIEYYVMVNMYHLSAQGIAIGEHIINVHYYYYKC